MALSWNSFKAGFRYDFIWRTLIFLVALAVLIVITTRWNRWEGNAKWQSTDDAYLQADLTPIASKVAGYVRALPQLFDRIVRQNAVAEPSAPPTKEH